MSAAATTQAPRADRPEPLYAKLHPGPGALDHDAVAGNQRSRLIGAMIEEVTERGYAGTTLARLVALAGVSKRAFHELFGTKEAYFLATYDAIIGHAVKRICAAYRSEGDWQERLRAAFAAYAAEVLDEPKAARLVLVEVLGAGPAALARMRCTRLSFEKMVSASFGEAPDGATLPPLIVKGIVCGVERVMRQRLLAGDLEELPALADELVAWALSYRSHAAAGLARLSPAESNLLTPCCPTGSRQEGGEWARILRCATEIAASDGYERLSPSRIALRRRRHRDEVQQAVREHRAVLSRCAGPSQPGSPRVRDAGRDQERGVGDGVYRNGGAARAYCNEPRALPDRVR